MKQCKIIHTEDGDYHFLHKNVECMLHKWQKMVKYRFESVSLPCFSRTEKEIMDYLPQDPAILVSSVNMLLRDEEFDTLEALCYAFNREPWEVREYLFSHGFVWSEVQKQFRPIGYDSTDVGGEEDDSR